MPASFSPRLDILPAAQKSLWPELAQTPSHFTLYGGTAIALRLAHRQSVDFDFFSPTSFEPRTLVETIPYLKGSEIRRAGPNNLTVTVDRGGPVQIQFFGNFNLGQVAASEIAEGSKIRIASLLDLGGIKAAVVTQRAEIKDYLDVFALMTKAKLTLPQMLAAGLIIYGDEFTPLDSLKAISYHDDPSLADLPKNIRNHLSEAVRSTDPTKLPVLNAVRVRGKT
jgi:Nucleotidyl transferase AbiEii toxin, Type IV TA system